MSERPSWLVPAAVAVVVILILGIVGFIVVPHLRGSGGGVATASPSAKTSPKTSPKPSASPTSAGTPQAVPVYDPASAAPITKVMICSPATPCTFSGTSESSTACDLTSCHVEVAIYFGSLQKSTPVAYTFKFFDRCTGQTTDLPGPSGSTPASGYLVSILTDHFPVSIPAGVKSGALVAVAQQPAVAASAPLLLGSNTCG